MPRVTFSLVPATGPTNRASAPSRPAESESDDLERLIATGPAHPLAELIPDALQGWLLETRWDNTRLWALDLPTIQLPVDLLRWHYTLPWWRHDGRWFQLTPTQVLERPDDFPEHRDRIERADLSYPLHVTRRRGRWLVIDGIHRLVKADSEGAASVDAHPVSAPHLREVLVWP